MRSKGYVPHGLDYLQNQPKTIYWKIIAGNRKLSTLEDHDLIFDDYDLRIRKLDPRNYK